MTALASSLKATRRRETRTIPSLVSNARRPTTRPLGAAIAHVSEKSFRMCTGASATSLTTMRPVTSS